MVTDDTPLLPATEEHLVRQLLASFWPSHAFGVQHIGLLGGGYMNRNYSVLNSTTSFALRRYDYNTNPPVIRYEHSLLRFLPERLHRAAVPRPLPTINGATIANRRGRYYALFPLIEGERFDRGEEGLLHEAGRTLAAYHNAASRYTPEPRLRPTYGSVERLDWVARHTSGLPDLWAGVSALPAHTPREQFILSSIESLKDGAACLQRELKAGGYARLPKLVIHNDFGPQNLLCRGQAVTALLDFDLVAWDARAYDLALALFWFGEDPSLDPLYPLLPGDRPWSLNAVRSRTFYRAYAGDLDPPLRQNEIDLLPALMRTAILWFVVWYLDLRLAGQPWHPEELSGILACLRWFAPNAQSYVSTVLGHH